MIRWVERGISGGVLPIPTYFLTRPSVRYFSSSHIPFKQVAGPTTSAGPNTFLGRDSNNLSVGLVGLANVGKSTIFQILTQQTQIGNPANYPFATIDAIKSIINIKSPILDHYQTIFQSEKKIESNLMIWDIAGLTRNASSGEGLGNQFLNDIRNVDGIMHVLRGFQDEEIIHIENNEVDPIRDLTIVNDELILKDLEVIENNLDRLNKLKKKPVHGHNVNKIELENEFKVFEKLQDLLYDGLKINQVEWDNPDEITIINKYHFLTAKPTLYLLNVNEHDYKTQTNQYLSDIQHWLTKNSPHDKLLMISANYESSLLEQEELTNSTIVNEIITSMKSALNLISFYTCGPKECHQWNLRRGNTVQEAAGLIHTDLQKTFISSIVYKWVDLKNLDLFNESLIKSQGKQYKQGKKYLVEDGDVVIIKAGSGKAR
ncbi:P-loop containing nucleoside triphosphate hydrolase protein [Scheffersomyces coipomensis]|uniref:P-loop containing nucleoside triphosphate hydrolase protein n=1 Tax=Scheffersomyces coipomensis TaxID=1788519 RepID=UPI00315CC2B2